VWRSSPLTHASLVADHRPHPTYLQKLAAVFLAFAPGSYVRTSTNSGETWTEQTGGPQGRWGAIASSADGTVRK